MTNPRNQNLNAAYLPPWQQPENPMQVAVPQGDTRFDPFIGTGWGEWLDSAGAGDPGGVDMAMRGLKRAAKPKAAKA